MAINTNRLLFLDVGNVLFYNYPKEEQLNRIKQLGNSERYKDIFSLANPEGIDQVLAIAKKYNETESIQPIVSGNLPAIAKPYVAGDNLASKIFTSEERSEVFKATHAKIGEQFLKLLDYFGERVYLFPSCDPWQVSLFSKEFGIPETRIIRTSAGEKVNPNKYITLIKNGIPLERSFLFDDSEKVVKAAQPYFLGTCIVPLLNGNSSDNKVMYERTQQLIDLFPHSKEELDFHYTIKR